MIPLSLNGEQKKIAESSSLQELVLSVWPSTAGVAVAINNIVVPKSTWDETKLAAGDTVEILTAAPGG